MAREIAMIGQGTIVQGAGGRHGTVSELAMALDMGKVTVLQRGPSGITEVYDQVILQSTAAGKAPLAPVFVTPDFDKVIPSKFDSVADRVVDQVIRATLLRLQDGPLHGHLEVARDAKLYQLTRLRLRGDETTDKMTGEE